MAKSCIIKRGKDRRVESVSTVSGSRSVLFDRLASIPIMENRDRAADFLKFVYSNDFIRRFGNWVKDIPRNRKAYNKVKRRISSVPQEYREAVLDKARGMDNPVLASYTGRSSRGNYFYTEDLSPENGVFLFDMFGSEKGVDLSKDAVPSSMTDEEYENSMLDINGGMFTRLTGVDAAEHLAVSGRVSRFTPEDLSAEGPVSGVTYPNGEPRLFFLADDGLLFDNYGDALKHTTSSEIKAGFISDSNSVRFDERIDNGNIHVLGNILSEDSFIPLMTISTSVDTNTKQGLINYLIKNGYLSGTKTYDPETNNYYHIGAGYSGGMKMFNSAVSYSELKNLIPDLVSMNDRGLITIRNRDDSKVTIVEHGGKSRQVSKDEILSSVRQGRYDDLDKRYRYMDALIVSLIMETSNSDSGYSRKLVSSLSEQERDMRNRLLNVLKKLGVRVIGMSDYLSRYKTKYGHEPSAKALADIANGVIAVADGADISDVIEEVAHFLVEAYSDQEAIESAMNGIENTSEWKEHSGRYYEIYGRTLSGSELDDAVRREILGKIISSRILNGTRTSETTFISRLRNLWNSIVDFIRNNIGSVRNELNSVIDDIENSVSSGSLSSFNPSLLRNSDFVLYSASSMDRNSFLRRKIAELRKVSLKLRQLASGRGAISEISLSRMADIERRLKEVDSNIEDHEIILALEGIVSTAEGQIEYLKRVIDSYDGNEGLKSEDRQNIQIVNDEVQPLLTSLRGFVKNNLNFSGIKSETGDNVDERQVRKEFTDRIDKAVSDINAIQSDVDSALEKDSSAFVESLINYFNIPAQHREKVRRAFFSVQEACGWLSRWFGILEHSNNVMNNALGALIARDNYEAMVETENDIREFVRKAESEGWNIEKYERIIQSYNGKLSKYLRGPLNLAKFEYDYKVEQMKAFRTVLSKSNDQWSSLTDSDIEDIVSNDRYFQFSMDAIDDSGNTIKRNVRFKPSINRVNVDILDAEQEKEYSDIMRRWREENEEQPYKVSYSSVLDEIYRKCDEAGTPVSERTREFLNNVSRQKYMIREPFYENGEFNAVRFYSSIAYDDYTRIQRSVKEAMSEYMYIGGQRVLKTGADADLAREIRAFYKVRREAFGESSQFSSYRVSRKFLDTLNEMKGNPLAAWNFLTRGGHISFSDRYWESTGLRMTDTTPSGARVRYRKLIEDIENNAGLTISQDDIDSIMDNIDNASEIIRTITSDNRDSDNPGEVVVGEMTASEVETYFSALQAKEDEIKKLMDLAKRAGLEYGDYVDMSDATESEMSSHYWNDLMDSPYSMEPYKFDMMHMTPGKRFRADEFLKKIMHVDNRSLYYASEIRYLKSIYPDKLGKIGTGTPEGKKAFKKVLHSEILKNMSQEEKTRLVSGFTKTLVAPYYKRFAPKGYDKFLSRAKSGGIDFVQLVEDLQNGTSYGDYGDFDIRNLRFIPNSQWYDETSQEASGKNPNYRPDMGFGFHIPKFDKYMDDSYFEHFGIDKSDMFGKATRNTEEFSMIEELKRINEKALGNYRIRNKNIYAIPQISKTTLERVHGLFSNPSQTIGNFIRDNIMDRVDDSLYGNIDNRTDMDESDRIKAIPKYYTYDLEDQNDVSHDLTYSFSMLASQANLYVRKQASLAKAMGLQNMMLNSQFNNGKKPEATMAYSMFKDFMNEHYYGIRMNMRKQTFNVAGFEIDATKIAWTFNKFISIMNLALSPFVAFTGMLTGQANLYIESTVGQYIDRNSWAYAQKELLRLIPGYVSEIGDLDRKSKLYVVGEYLGVFNYRNRLYGAGYSKVERVLTRNPMYKLMEVTNAPLDPAIMIASLDGVRYLSEDIEGSETDDEGNARKVRKGFYTLDELKAEYMAAGISLSDIKSKWNGMRKDSLWNMIDARDGAMVPAEGASASADEIAGEVARRRPRVRSLMQICNGSLSEENRVGAARNWLGLFTVAHRGWMFLTAQRLWKKRGYNFQTLQEEEGLLISLKNRLKTMFNLCGEKNIKELKKAWDESYDDLDETAKINIIRSGIYACTFLLLNLVTLALSGWRDDDEDEESWTTQFVAYIGLRTVNELASQMPGIFALNIVDAVEEPFVSVRKAGELLNFDNYSLDKVDTGIYKGETKLWRLLAKQTFIKQWYNIKTPESIKQTMDWWIQTNNKSMMLFRGANRSGSGEDDEQQND